MQSHTASTEQSWDSNSGHQAPHSILTTTKLNGISQDEIKSLDLDERIGSRPFFGSQVLSHTGAKVTADCLDWNYPSMITPVYIPQCWSLDSLDFLNNVILRNKTLQG